MSRRDAWLNTAQRDAWVIKTGTQAGEGRMNPLQPGGIKL